MTLWVQPLGETVARETYKLTSMDVDPILGYVCRRHLSYFGQLWHLNFPFVLRHIIRQTFARDSILANAPRSIRSRSNGSSFLPKPPRKLNKLHGSFAKCHSQPHTMHIHQGFANAILAGECLLAIGILCFC